MCFDCLFVCFFYGLFLDRYILSIYSNIEVSLTVTMDFMNFISCCLCVSCGSSSISCLTAILKSVVAHSNKNFHFLCALGYICEILSISCLAAILNCLLPLATTFHFLSGLCELREHPL